MWFSIKTSTTVAPPIVVNNDALSVVCKQRYLRLFLTANLRKWTRHFASVCKSMSYYLMMIDSHAKNFPSSIIKMLIES